MSESFEQRVQRLGEDHLAACEQALCDNDNLPVAEWTESPSVGPYCGCDTCIVREILWVAWEAMLAKAEAAR
jgi:hypothetical protein